MWIICKLQRPDAIGAKRKWDLNYTLRRIECVCDYSSELMKIDCKSIMWSQSDDAILWISKVRFQLNQMNDAWTINTANSLHMQIDFPNNQNVHSD